MQDTPTKNPKPTAAHAADSAQPAAHVSTHTAPATRTESIRSVISTVAVLLLAPIIAILLTAFVFQSYQVDGPSMETTLQNNDRLIVWKAPRTWARITGNSYIPNRGDVIIFNQGGLPNAGSSDTRQLIKRVVGLPGDKVIVKDGVITVFNKANPKGFQPDRTLPYGDVIPETSGDIDVTLSNNQVFVAGDNRPESLDSRTFGPIEADQIVGKLVLRMLPINNMKLF